MKLIVELPEGERVVGMTEFQGRLIVAMTCGIYEVKGDKLVPIEMVTDQASRVRARISEPT